MSSRFALAVVLVLASPTLASAQTCECAPELIETHRVRIREHLRRVEAELRAVPTDHLTAAQREARARNLDRLHDYMLRGDFPHGAPDQPSPISPTFIDADGRACAMAHLVIESGAREVAEEIARTELHAYVPEITHPALGPWLEANGMTLAEAALVQPGYPPCPCDGGPAYYCAAPPFPFSGGGFGLTPCRPADWWACFGGYPATMAEDGGWYCQPDGGELFWPGDGGPDAWVEPEDAGVDAPAPDARFDALDAGRDAGRDGGRMDAGVAPMDAGVAPPDGTRACGCSVGSTRAPLALPLLGLLLSRRRR